MNLKLYMQPVITEALGPYKRYAIWVQGCYRHCKQCISPDSWDNNGGKDSDINDLVNEIINISNIEGITISGGEPFLQQEALCELIKKVRHHKDIGVIVYTGYQYKEIEETELASLSDIIIDGEYIDELNDDLSLRGSSNQSIVCLTDRYKDLIDSCYGVHGRKIEMYLKGEKSFVVGIPSKNLNL